MQQQQQLKQPERVSVGVGATGKTLIKKTNCWSGQLLFANIFSNGPFSQLDAFLFCSIQAGFGFTPQAPLHDIQPLVVLVRARCVSSKWINLLAISRLDNRIEVPLSPCIYACI